MAQNASVACWDANDQGFCWKAKSCGWWSKHGLCGATLCITWIREPHASVWVKNGIVTAGRARRFFLAKVVSVTYQPWHLYTFHLCGCWNARRLGYRSVRTGKRVFRNCQSSNVSEDRPWSIQGLPRVRSPGTFARVSRTRRGACPLPRLMTEIQFPIRVFRLYL